MSDVIRKRDLQVVDAIEGDAIKQALSLCAKRLKKGEKGDSLYAVRAWALAESPNAVHNEEALVEVEKLVHKEPAVLDLDTLVYLQRAIEVLKVGPPSLIDQQKAATHLEKLWSGALRAQPRDEVLNREVFYVAFAARQWKVAQQAAMNLQKHSTNRLYHFWAIYSCYILAVNTKVDNEKNLFSTLAVRMISKAAEAAVPDREGLTSPKAIQTVEELRLLLSIYGHREMLTEIGAVCKHEQLGISSALAKGDWTVVTAYLQVLEKQEKWDTLHSECLKLLDGEYGFDGDDWKVWQFLITATTSSSEQSLISQTEDTIQKFSSKRSRNAKLAKLELFSVKTGSFQEYGKTASQVEECFAYLLSAGSKPSCFDDLVPSISTFDEPQTADFIQKLEALTDQSPAVNATKHALLYTLRESNPNRAKLLDNLVTSCLTSYTEFIKSTAVLATAETDAAEANLILAVMTLYVRSTSASSASAAQLDILRAAIILEHSLTVLPNNYQATLILLLLYRHLGAASKLFYLFPRLNVKNMQFESLSHYLLTRIATFHPFIVPQPSDLKLEKEQREPESLVSNLLGTYGRPRDKINGYVKLSLQSGNYSNIQSFLDLQDAYEQSLVRALNTLEERRIFRLTHSKKGSTDPRLLDIWDVIPSQLVDKRDFQSLANYEHPSRAPFIELLNSTPTPGEQYIKAYELVETLYLALRLGVEAPQNRFPPIQVTSLPVAFSEIEQNTRWEKDFTSAEKSYVLLGRTIADAYFYLQSGPASSLDKAEVGAKVSKILERIPQGASLDVASALKALQISDKAIIDGPFLLSSFTYLECTKLLSTFTDALSSLPKSTKAMLPPLAPLEDATSKLREDVRITASRYRNDLSESGVVGGLVDRVLGRDVDGGADTEIGSAIESFVDEGHIEIILGSIVESWIDACDGILKVT